MNEKIREAVENLYSLSEGSSATNRFWHKAGIEQGYQAAWNTRADEAKAVTDDEAIQKLERERNDAVAMLQGIARQIQSAYPHKALTITKEGK